VKGNKNLAGAGEAGNLWHATSHQGHQRGIIIVEYAQETTLVADFDHSAGPVLALPVETPEDPAPCNHEEKQVGQDLGEQHRRSRRRRQQKQINLHEMKYQIEADKSTATTSSHRRWMRRLSKTHSVSKAYINADA